MSSEAGNRWNLRKFLVFGYICLFLLVGGIGSWAVLTSIRGAVVAAGSIEVEGNRQIVQHLSGGVISAIHARDGDEVQEGDILIQLEGRTLITELEIVEGQWFEVLARKSRLSSERDGLDEIQFVPELLEEAENHPEIQQLMDAQIQQFEARRQLREEETQQLAERQVQISNQIDGLVSLAAATDTQIKLLDEEIEGQEELYKQGLTQVARVLALRRDLASLHGTEGQVAASISENRGKIAEIEIERVRLMTAQRDEAITQLRDLEYREIELRERRRALLDQVERLDLRAPVSGVVYGSTADTLRGVIRAAEPVMYIVPKDTPLVARTQIETIHIDQVFVGQEANLRFSAFDMRTTPELPGKVHAVSADAIVDEQLGARYYRVDIEVDANMIDALGDKTLLPGMPVEAYISTSPRSPLNYLMKPFLDYFNRAFRDG
ncbi:HlyD family type I secretion periplasmic adaptor subunit [Amaricoccus tamworthensis]|uniref:HlyD family type I secretion periplasmic adaptor subunit n=1 Tax=Amaricoccus tamworthensis TaxID=57002 RepID=UPI003C7C577B